MAQLDLCGWRWKCKLCGAISRNDELLTAPNPFDPKQEVLGCPKCKQCDHGWLRVCDEPDCKREACTGWPTGDNKDRWGGYRQTCHEHSRVDKEPA